MRPQLTLKRTLAAIALAALSALAPVSVQATPRDCGNCGMFGVARGQIARINVAHIGEPGSRPIQVDMTLVDAAGTIVARDSKTLEPGQAAFFDVPFETVGGDESRIELRPVIGGTPNRNLASSVEVFDADTGRTTVFISNPEI